MDVEIGYVAIPETILPSYMIAIKYGISKILFAKEPFWKREKEKELFLKCWDNSKIECEISRMS